ncbi:type V secretion system putative substrate protein [Paraburkholderia tropica]|uniref:Type V secretion system putative substrate protein n=1 Tax=Paraburkholderia tropica TaxID=92647 RepID=A0ABX5MIX7_9BURK|nr:type V secretion system putative substrate protein [Paraburkholderia tropica]PZW73949.1 type V secretion system putative substrate protein [Paraburkholderia tropica]
MNRNFRLVYSRVRHMVVAVEETATATRYRYSGEPVRHYDRRRRLHQHGARRADHRPAATGRQRCANRLQRHGTGSDRAGHSAPETRRCDGATLHRYLCPWPARTHWAANTRLAEKPAQRHTHDLLHGPVRRARSRAAHPAAPAAGTGGRWHCGTGRPSGRPVVLPRAASHLFRTLRGRAHRRSTAAQGRLRLKTRCRIADRRFGYAMYARTSTPSG